MPFSSSKSQNYSFKTKEFHLPSNHYIKHDKTCKDLEYLNVQAELSAKLRAELSAMYGPSCPRAELSTGRVVPVRESATVRMLPICKRGFYNAVFSQVKCRSTRFYSLTSLGTNEQWKEDLRSELVSFLREQNRIKFGALRGTSQFIIQVKKDV